MPSLKRSLDRLLQLGEISLLDHQAWHTELVPTVDAETTAAECSVMATLPIQSQLKAVVTDAVNPNLLSSIQKGLGKAKQTLKVSKKNHSKVYGY